MKAKWYRIFALVTVAALIGGTFAFFRQEKQRERAIEGEMPPALGKHIERLMEAVPGNGGEPAEGPGSR